eukprot:4690372-Lingulodinium_polyedra.AAC.1
MHSVAPNARALFERGARRIEVGEGGLGQPGDVRCLPGAVGLLQLGAHAPLAGPLLSDPRRDGKGSHESPCLATSRL